MPGPWYLPPGELAFCDGGTRGAAGARALDSNEGRALMGAAFYILFFVSIAMGNHHGKHKPVPAHGFRHWEQCHANWCDKDGNVITDAQKRGEK
jgi:hypothetical protein